MQVTSTAHKQPEACSAIAADQGQDSQSRSQFRKRENIPLHGHGQKLGNKKGGRKAYTHLFHDICERLSLPSKQPWTTGAAAPLNDWNLATNMLASSHGQIKWTL